MRKAEHTCCLVVEAEMRNFGIPKHHAICPLSSTNDDHNYGDDNGDPNKRSQDGQRKP